MAHELKNRNDMAYAGATPWHKLGVSMNDASEHLYNAHEWKRRSACDFQVESRPVFFQMPDGTFRQSALGNVFVRADTNDELGMVGPLTHPLQNDSLFDCAQSVLDTKLVTMETCGNLNGGARVWILCKITNGTRDVVAGDTLENYILFSNPHDGSGALFAGLTTVRVVCANTERAARANDAKTLIKVTHSANVLEKTENATLAIGELLATADNVTEQFRFLASKRNLTSAKLKEYVETVFSMKPAARKNGKVELSKQNQTKLDDILRIHDRNSGIVQEMLASMKEREAMERETHSILGVNLLDAVLANMEAGKGTDIATARGSWWSALNSVTEFLTHKQGRSDESRLFSGTFGPNALLTDKALTVAMTMAQAV